MIEILFERQSGLSLSWILLFGVIGDAFINYVSARLLKKLIKLIALEHLQLPITHD